MSSRSTRNKIRWQGTSALEDLKKAQVHFVQLAALADDRSDYINKHVPALVALLESLIHTVEEFNAGL
ncbi:unnamed protein product [marine sediment metagenome]|uniref:Uncharacterized protein n=1 Tax=marine sediment metagenome TaxID=412755 RepID=X1PKQ3_9ZZZZ